MMRSYSPMSYLFVVLNARIVCGGTTDGIYTEKYQDRRSFSGFVAGVDFFEELVGVAAQVEVPEELGLVLASQALVVWVLVSEDFGPLYGEFAAHAGVVVS